MIRRPPRSTLSSSSAASDVYKRQELCIAESTIAQEVPKLSFGVRHATTQSPCLAHRPRRPLTRLAAKPRATLSHEGRGASRRTPRIQPTHCEDSRPAKPLCMVVLASHSSPHRTLLRC